MKTINNCHDFMTSIDYEINYKIPSVYNDRT